MPVDRLVFTESNGIMVNEHMLIMAVHTARKGKQVAGSDVGIPAFSSAMWKGNIVSSGGGAAAGTPKSRPKGSSCKRKVNGSERVVVASANDLEIALDDSVTRTNKSQKVQKEVLQDAASTEQALYPESAFIQSGKCVHTLTRWLIAIAKVKGGI